MKFLYYIIFFFLFQANFAQEQVTFYFDNNKFELNKLKLPNFKNGLLKIKRLKFYP